MKDPTGIASMLFEGWRKEYGTKLGVVTEENQVLKDKYDAEVLKHEETATNLGHEKALRDKLEVEKYRQKQLNEATEHNLNDRIKELQSD